MAVGASLTGRIVRVTVVPLGPRTFPTASSTVMPSTVAPSMWVTTSPASMPALSAGDSSIGLTMTSWQVGPSGVQSPEIRREMLWPRLERRQLAVAN